MRLMSCSDQIEISLLFLCTSIGSFCDQNHSCIIFYSRVMKNLDCLMGVLEIKNFNSYGQLKVTFQKLQLVIKTMYQAMHAGKYFHQFFENTEFWGLCATLSEAILKKKTANFDLSAQYTSRNLTNFADISLICRCWVINSIGYTFLYIGGVKMGFWAT